MPTKAKQLTKDQKAFRFYRTATGRLVLAIIIWIVAYALFFSAVDSGSLIEWLGVIIGLFWGLYHLTESLRLFIRKLCKTTTQSRKI